MEELELVLEVLERGPNGIETLGFLDGRVVIVDPEVLDENEPGPAGVLNGVVFEINWNQVLMRRPAVSVVGGKGQLPIIIGVWLARTS
nr:hypothetical protein CFP56_35310 [Quercus suber]POF15674.1 hypothetical protein CFP56_35313 [Quercus suber]